MGQLHRFDDGEAKPPGRPLEAGRRVHDEKLSVFVAVLRQHKNIRAGRLFPVLGVEAPDARGAPIFVVFEDAHTSARGYGSAGTRAAHKTRDMAQNAAATRMGQASPIDRAFRNPDSPGPKGCSGPPVAAWQ